VMVHSQTRTKHARWPGAGLFSSLLEAARGDS
jgi:hypothetical protein